MKQHARTILATLLLGVLVGGAALAQGGPVTFTFAHPGPIRTMDAPVTWFGSTHWLTNTLYDCLIWRAADGDGYVGQAAESWSATDDTTWRFVLREGLTFHNGEPLDAEAVKWNIDRTRSRVDFLVQPQWAFVKDVIVVDERTLDITTEVPMAYFEFDVSYNGCQILPPKYMAEVGEEEFARNPVGSGPYKLVEFTASDRYVFEAWDGYWAGRPEVDRIVYQVIPEQSSQIAALLAGQIDFVRAIPPVERARLAAASGIQLLRGPASVQHILYVRYQTETGVIAANYPGFEPITADVRIRQAISHAIDRELLAEVQGSGRPSLLRTDEFNPEHRGQYAGEAAAVAHYDPERARALIVEAGFDPPPATAPCCTSTPRLPAGQREGGRRGPRGDARGRRLRRRAQHPGALRLPGADLQPRQLPRHRPDLGRRQPLAGPAVLHLRLAQPERPPLRPRRDRRLGRPEHPHPRHRERRRAPRPLGGVLGLLRREGGRDHAPPPRLDDGDERPLRVDAPRRRLDDLPRPQAAPLNGGTRCVEAPHGGLHAAEARRLRGED
jgi:hypothetical protein